MIDWIHLVAPIEQRREDRELFKTVLRFIQTGEMATQTDGLTLLNAYAKTLGKISQKYERKFAKMLEKLGLNSLLMVRTIFLTLALFLVNIYIYIFKSKRYKRVISQL